MPVGLTEAIHITAVPPTKLPILNENCAWWNGATQCLQIYLFFNMSYFYNNDRRIRLPSMLQWAISVHNNTRAKLHRSNHLNNMSSPVQLLQLVKKSAAWSSRNTGSTGMDITMSAYRLPWYWSIISFNPYKDTRHICIVTEKHRDIHIRIPTFTRSKWIMKSTILN